MRCMQLRLRNGHVVMGQCTVECLGLESLEVLDHLAATCIQVTDDMYAELLHWCDSILTSAIFYDPSWIPVRLGS